jgi:hypothetical protein
MADLLNRGLEVYKAISGHAPTDLVVEIGDRLYKVEVKTVGRDFAGHPYTPTGNLDRKGHQILAVVDAVTQAIRYQPAVADLDLDVLTSLPFPDLPNQQKLALAVQGFVRAADTTLQEPLAPVERSELVGMVDTMLDHLRRLRNALPAHHAC